MDLATFRTRARKALARRLAGAERGPALHFLHIGKNAGTQIMRIAGRVEACADLRVVKHPHGVRLRDLPEGEDYFFSIRAPETRFRSAFYSRKRKGQPRIYAEWSAHERLAFERFEDANDLAEALSGEGADAMAAIAAMKSISHCSMDQIDWFDRCGNFLALRPPLDIVRQERFEHDMARLLGRLGVRDPGALRPEDDAVSAHRNDYAAAPPLSETAVANLRRWYWQDVVFYDMCARWIEDRD